MSWPRVAAVLRKEVRDYRRNRLVILTMAVLPVVFLITPMVTLFNVPETATGPQARDAVGLISLLLLIIPIVIPPVISAYSVVGERDQGTLEPVLTAPIEASELLLGKALAAFIPSVAIGYALYLVVLVSVGLGAAPIVRTVFFQPGQVLVQVLFTPLLALWTIWACIAASTRASDVRVAQQLGSLAGLPLLAFTALISFQVITPTVPIASGLALTLLAIDYAGWRVCSRLFNRERLITGRTSPTPRHGRRG